MCYETNKYNSILALYISIKFHGNNFFHPTHINTSIPSIMFRYLCIHTDMNVLYVGQMYKLLGEALADILANGHLNMPLIIKVYKESFLS